MTDFALWTRAVQARTESALSRFLPDASLEPRRLHEAMRYVALGGGKRVRPMLAFAAGATDAFAFLLLGGVFTANMTGNLVLAGLTERPGYATMIVCVIIAILAFAVGLFAAFRAAPPGSASRRLVVVLAAGLVAQIGVLIGWLLHSLFGPGNRLRP